MISEEGEASGGRIVQARLENGGMQQKQLAEALGLSARSVQSYESGEIIPWRFMEDLERILHKPAIWFMRGEPTGLANSEALALLSQVQQTSTEALQSLRDHLELCNQIVGLLREAAAPPVEVMS
jgi:transcriptional regulator with XRE-family HTH domain